VTVRIAALLAALVLLAPAVAVAQDDAFGPLPPPAPEPTPQPTASPGLTTDDSDISRELLFLIGGGLLIIFTAITVTITRDARRALPEDARKPEQLREQGPHKHSRDAKAKARAKTRAQRKARRAARRAR
jgi:hypothetical protein